MRNRSLIIAFPHTPPPPSVPPRLDTENMSDAGKAAQDVNAALEAALDDFDDEEEVESELKTAQALPPPMAGPSPPPASEADLMERMMQELFSGQGENDNDGNDNDMPPELAMMGQFLQQMQAHMAQELQQQEKQQSDNPARREKATSPPTQQSTPSPSSRKSKASPSMSTPTAPSSSSSNTPLDKTIANLVESMAQHQLSGNDGPNDDTVTDELPPNADSFLDSLMEGNPDALLQGMMEELMKKEIMAEPIQQVAAAFPDWLRKHEKELTPEEYQKRKAQSKAFARLAEAYRDNSTDTSRLVELMQDVQDFGQPPPDLVQRIAPDLQLDGDGMPALSPDDCRTM